MKISGTRKKPLVETQMISLADIAFLVIFFFLTTSSFMREKKLDLALPVMRHTDHSAARISVSVDKTGKIYLDNEEMYSADLLGTILKARLMNRKPEDCQVRSRCDKTVQHKVYGPLIKAIVGAGGVLCIIHDVPS